MSAPVQRPIAAVKLGNLFKLRQLVQKLREHCRPVRSQAPGCSGIFFCPKVLKGPQTLKGPPMYSEKSSMVLKGLQRCSNLVKVPQRSSKDLNNLVKRPQKIFTGAQKSSIVLTKVVKCPQSSSKLLTRPSPCGTLRTFFLPGKCYPRPGIYF